MVSLATTEAIHEYASSLKANGCLVYMNHDSGTIEARDGDQTVFRGIQKGFAQPWVVNFTDSERIKWKESDS